MPPLPRLPQPRTAVLALLAMTALTVLQARAEPPVQSELAVRDAWIRQPPPGTQVAAAYLTLSNLSSHRLTVSGFDSPVAEAAMLHSTQLVSGQSRMRPQATLALTAGETVVLKPGGLHVMLHGLKQALVPGQHVPLVISLADGRTLTVSALVRPIGSE